MIALLASPLGRYAMLAGAVLFASGVAYLKGRWDGRDAEAAIWTAHVADLKANASRLLADETARVLAAEREIAALVAKVEALHAARIADLDAATGKYNRLGKLFEQTRTRCGSGGGGPGGTTAAASAVRGELPPAPGDVSRAPDETLGTIARDADELRAVFKTCQDYVTALPGVVGR